MAPRSLLLSMQCVWASQLLMLLWQKGIRTCCAVASTHKFMPHSHLSGKLSTASLSFLISHHRAEPSVDTVMASLPVLDCSHAKSYTGSLQQWHRHTSVVTWQHRMCYFHRTAASRLQSEAQSCCGTLVTNTAGWVARYNLSPGREAGTRLQSGTCPRPSVSKLRAVCRWRADHNRHVHDAALLQWRTYVICLWVLSRLVSCLSVCQSTQTARCTAQLQPSWHP